jgi:putative ABC transport system permease protein
VRLALATASLRRHRARTALAVLGVAISAAMLLDMVMLSSGLRESFRDLLESRGFQLRMAPRGTLPFDTEATVPGAARIVATLRRDARVESVSPVLGATVHVRRDSGAVAAFGLGLDPSNQGDYELLEGEDATAPDRFVANDDFLRVAGIALGDTITLATGYNPQLRSWAGERRLVAAGRGRFLYMSAGQPAVAMPLATLQGMSEGVSRAASEDRISLAMVRLRPGADADSVAAWIDRAVPSMSAISTRQALATVDERLSYFRQLSYILGAVSLVVGFLLVTTLVTVSVNERVGEIAVMRAIGVSRAHVVQQILVEGLAISLAGAALGLLLGLVTARWLNTILSAFPGLPMAIDFFRFQPRAAWSALGMLVASGVAAGIYPAWRASSLPIARTLREEAVA